MKKDNESPYRYYRVVSVKKIDRWFFDRYDHRRTHAKIYETVIRPKFGMCENTFLDYRHEPDELLELFPQSASVEFSLWLPTVQTKYMVPAEANRFSLMLWDSIDKAFRCIRRREPGLLHRRRQVTDVYDALSGRKIIRRDEVTQLMNEERGCPNNSGSPGIFVRSFRFRFGESAEVFAK